MITETEKKEILIRHANRIKNENITFWSKEELKNYFLNEYERAKEEGRIKTVCDFRNFKRTIIKDVLEDINSY